MKLNPNTIEIRFIYVLIYVVGVLSEGCLQDIFSYTHVVIGTMLLRSQITIQTPLVRTLD